MSRRAATHPARKQTPRTDTATWGGGVASRKSAWVNSSAVTVAWMERRGYTCLQCDTAGHSPGLLEPRFPFLLRGIAITTRLAAGG